MQYLGVVSLTSIIHQKKERCIDRVSIVKYKNVLDMCKLCCIFFVEV